MNDYGHMDEEIPSLAIALFEEYRNQGIGTVLMKAMLQRLKEAGYRQVSLSVQKANYAMRMYEKAGFRTVRDNPEECVMVREL